MTQTHDEDNNRGMSRRSLMRRSAAATVAVGSVGYGSLRLDNGPVQNSEAIAPVVAAGAIGASAAVGWALRETEVIGSDAPPEGLTANALHDEVYNSAKSRKSNLQSTFVDNENILDGMQHTAYSDAKIAAIEQINDEASESDALDSANDVIDDYETTVQRNLLKSWSEAVDELESYSIALDEHSDINTTDVIEGGTSSPFESVDFDEFTYQLPDGSEINVSAWVMENDNPQPVEPTHTSEESGGQGYAVQVYERDGTDDISYLTNNDWNDFYEDIVSTFDYVRDNIGTWLTSAYDEVVDGDLDTSDLLTSREQAALTSDDENYPQAIADLEALNVAIDYEREAEILFKDIGATLNGRLGHTGDQTLSTGEYDPTESDDTVDTYLDGDVYLTYDVSEGSGDWSEVETTVDGGTVVFTSEPFESTLYLIESTDGDTVEVSTSDFSENDSGNYEVDISDDLETATTEVDSVQFFSETEETQYETIKLSEPFEIIGFSDSDGEEYQESDFERSEPHDDTNYISEEEWQEQQDRHEELIDKYEESQGGGMSFGNSDSQLLATAAAAGALIIALLGR